MLSSFLRMKCQVHVFLSFSKVLLSHLRPGSLSKSILGPLSIVHNGKGCLIVDQSKVKSPYVSHGGLQYLVGFLWEICLSFGRRILDGLSGT